MFFILSKILYYLAMPITWILAALLVAVFAKKQTRKNKGLIATLILLLFFTNPFLINEALLLWETPPTPIRSVGNYDAAIILTGMSNQEKSPHDRMYVGSAADRVLHPLHLYREGRFQYFVISGGSGSLRRTYSTEAAEIKNLLVRAGIPDSLILVEEQSRNTYENAQFTARLLQEHPQLKKLLLVTSAFHIRRAKGCFDKAGVPTHTFATDFYTSDRAFTPDRLLVPQEASLYKWQKLIHEMLGYAIYKAMGYI
jgi:uncharacterized SAM-binding protein YcdF (DUF218 family)